MKSLVLIVLAFSASTSFAATAAKTADPHQGRYSNPTLIYDEDVKTGKSCAAKDGEWVNGLCYTPNENTVRVSKIRGTKDQYVVSIDILSVRLNMCNVAEVFTGKGNVLHFTAKDKSTIALYRKGNKMIVVDNYYSESNCGHNARIGGAYTRRSAGKSVDQIDADDIKECGFAGCLN